MNVRGAVGCVMAAAAVVSTLGCSDGGTSRAAAVAIHDPALDALTARVEPGWWRGQGAETVEVWVCRVPADSTAPAYGGLEWRAELDPVRLTDELAPAGDYFATLSNGVYRPFFAAGGVVDLAATDGPEQCVEAALAASTTAADVVLAIADAEQAEGQPGGLGNGGDCPAAPPCPATQSRRYAYVGASDFHPEWGDRPPLDLVEHELGHTLGLVHSGYDPTAPQPYTSALDVMSNSAAPRDTQPDRRDAPGTLAIQRVIAGWLDLASLAVVPSGGAMVALSPSAGTDGVRGLVLPVDDLSFLTVELLPAAGLDAHLPHGGGVAVHLVALGDDGIRIDPLAGVPADTLLTEGGMWNGFGWSVTVDARWRVTVAQAGA